MIASIYFIVGAILSSIILYLAIKDINNYLDDKETYFIGEDSIREIEHIAGIVGMPWFLIISFFVTTIFWVPMILLSLILIYRDKK